MSTKKFKLGNADGNNVKGGRNNTRTILTAAGVVAFGAAAGGGGYAAGVAYGHPTPEPKPDEKVDEKTEEKPETQDNQQSNNSNSQQTAQQTQPQNGDNITEPQPTDTTQNQQVDNTQNQQVNNNQTNTNGGQEPVIDKPDEVNPDDIAQQIINEQNIDPYDIDSPTIISVDELATLYRADGSEMLVAAVHTPDGSQFVLADVDGDGYFTDVFDMAGNYVGEAEGNLMASDLEAMVDPTGGYLAHTSEEPQGDDPTNDIINTPNPTSSTGEDVAENSITVPASADDEVNDEELLAQLLDDEGEDERLIDDEDGEDEDDDVDDDEIDSADIIGA